MSEAGSLPGGTDREAEQNDFDVRHHLYNTIILLGGKKEIATLLKKSLDFGVTEEDLNALRSYNSQLTNSVKDRLANQNTIKVRPSGMR